MRRFIEIPLCELIYFLIVDSFTLLLLFRSALFAFYSSPGNPLCLSASNSTMATEFPRLKDRNFVEADMGMRIAVSICSVMKSEGSPAVSFPKRIMSSSSYITSV